MLRDEKLSAEEIREIWRTYLDQGKIPDFLNEPWYRHKPFSGLFHYLPDNPRCRICHSPFGGIGGAAMRHLFNIVPSRLNPELCDDCERFAERFHGGAEVMLSILFADVRGSTRLAEKMNPTDYSNLINRFYRAGTKVLFDRQAMVEKLIGDAITGFFTSGISGENHAQLAIESAQKILEVTGHHGANGPWIPVGIGVHTGVTYVGSVERDSGMTDIAVLGDTANVGARLAALAAPGEIYVSQATALAARLDTSGMEMRREQIKGRSEAVDFWVFGAKRV